MFERLKSEYSYLAGTVRIFARLLPIVKRPKRTISDQLTELAKRHGDRVAFLQDGRTSLTFRQLDEGANRVVRWARSVGIGKGDVVALHMLNRPEYMTAWIGIARAGGIAALINTNQVGASLAHSYGIARPKAAILDPAMARVFFAARGEMMAPPGAWVCDGGADGAEDFDAAMAAQSPEPLREDERADIDQQDTCLYIFTSGTTSLPKAARITHYRVLAGLNGFSAAMGAKSSDRMYLTLPLYHTTGCLLAAGAAFTVGGATIIRERFSARDFFPDIVRHDATMFQYVGELCRYLMATPPSPADAGHKVRLCCGNGLRPDIWPAFTARFGIAKVLEFYAATEGNVVLFNHDSKVGSVGRIPSWLQRQFNSRVIRFDIEKEIEVRDADGHCIECEPDEIGEVIGEVATGASRPASRYDGYADAESTKRKILRDVFRDGDLWFRTGDLMRRDAAGYFYFVDRVGDTFRWKGENVSTAEVAGALSGYPGVADANVYGVTVPGHEGRVGMAALVPGPGGIDLEALPGYLAGCLPAYAHPRFLRLQPEIEVTGTFKQRKVTLVAEGYDPSASDDRLYFSPSEGGDFVPLDAQTHISIASGRTRL